MAGFFRCANTSVLTRRTVAEVNLDLAVPSHVSWFAVTVVVIDQLDAILSAGCSARIGQALVDVTLAPRTDETWWTLAFEASDLIDAGTIVVAGICHAVVRVYLTNVAESSWRARTAKVIYEIMTGSPVLARIQATIVDVELAVLSLEALGTITLVRSNQVSASGAILTRSRVAFVDFGLAVASGVAFIAHATVAVADVFASTIVTQPSLGYSFSQSCVLARNHLDIADLASPARSALALVLVAMLDASGLVFAGRLGTPVHVFFTPLTREPVGTVTSVILYVVMTGGTVFTRIAVALIDAVLAVGTSVAWTTHASVVVYAVDASAAVHAGRVGTVLVVGLAVYTGKAESALTGVGVDVFLADGAILAGIRDALVDVDLAVLAAETVDAQTRIVADAVETGTAVLARI